MFEVGDKLVTRSRAVVIDNKDPNKRGRIRVEHPLLGETVWINYLKSPGAFDVPEIGDVVYLEADCGWDTHPVAHGNIVKGADGDPDIPEEFQRTIPTNRGFYTPGGHLVELDDGQTKLKTGAGIRITTSGGHVFSLLDGDGPAKTGKSVNLITSGGTKIQALEGTPAESQVVIEMPSGTTVKIDGVEDEVSIETAFGDSLAVSAADGIQLATPAAGGTSLSMTNGAVDLKSAQGDINMDDTGNIKVSNSAASLVLTPAGQVELKGTPGGLVDLMQQFAQTLATDTFAGFGAPAGMAAKYAEIAAKLLLLKAT